MSLNAPDSNHNDNDKNKVSVKQCMIPVNVENCHKNMASVV